MKEYLPFIIAGIASGSIYGLAAMGLVLSYKASGIFNFAHGAIAAGAAYLFFELHVKRGLAWPSPAPSACWGRRRCSVSCWSESPAAWPMCRRCVKSWPPSACCSPSPRP